MRKSVRFTILMALGFGITLGAGGLAALRDPAFWALVLAMTAWNVAEAGSLKTAEPTDYAARRNTRLLQLAVMTGALVGALDRWRLGWSALPGWVVPVGAGVILVGGALRVWAIRALDRHFTYELRVSADQPVIRDGPYRLVRHPSYLGLILIAVGVGLALGSWPGAIVGFASTAAMVLLRVRLEERVLRESFGAPYDDYSRETWALVPFVY